MSDDKTTLHLVVEHLAAAVLPLKEAVTDIESFKDFMFELGWEVNSLPISYSSLGSLVDEITTAVENLAENPDSLQILNALEKIRKLYNAIKGISDAPEGVDASVFL